MDDNVKRKRTISAALLYFFFVALHLMINRFEFMRHMVPLRITQFWLVIDIGSICVITLLCARVLHIRILHRAAWWALEGTLLGLAPLLLFNCLVAYPQHLTISTWWPIMWTLVELVLGVVFEELLGRAIVIPVIAQYTQHGLPVIVWSALAFSGTHLVNLTRQSLVQTGPQLLFTLLLGIVLGQVYVLTDNIICPIVVHGLWNASVTLPELLGTGYAFSESAMIDVLFVLGFATLFVIIRRNQHQITSATLKQFKLLAYVKGE